VIKNPSSQLMAMAGGGVTRTHFASTVKESGYAQTLAWPCLWVLSTHENKSLLIPIVPARIHQDLYSQQKPLPFLQNYETIGKGGSRQKEMDEGSSAHTNCSRTRSTPQQEGIAEQRVSYTSLRLEYPKENQRPLFAILGAEHH